MGYIMNIQEFREKAINVLGGFSEQQMNSRVGEVVSLAGSNEFTKFFLRPFNPADLYQKTSSYSIYDEAREDDQVGAILSMKKYMIMGSGWEIKADEEREEEIKDFVSWNFTDYLDRSFEQFLWELLSAFDYGYSITEKIFGLVPGGKYASKVGIKSLRTRPPHGIELHTDDFGTLDKVTQDEREYDPRKFIIFAHNPEFDNPYGSSDITLGVYRAWYTKLQVMKFWAMFLEKFGMPLVIGKYGKDATDASQQKILKILKNMQASTVATMPKEWEIDFEQAGVRTEGGYEKAIDKFNLMISRAMLVPDLMGMSGSKTSGGSFALGEKQVDIFLQTIEKDRKDTARQINKNLVDPLILFNYGEKAVEEGTTRFEYKPLTEDDRQQMAKTWIEAAKGRLWKPTEEEINHLRDITGFPEGPVEFSKEPEPVKPFDPNNPIKPDPEVTNPDKTEEVDEMSEFIPDRTLTFAEERVDFQEINRELLKSEKATKIRLAEVVRESINNMVSTIQTKKMLENKRLDIASNPPFKFKKKFEKVMRDAFKNIFKLGVVTATAEVTGKKSTDRLIDQFAMIDNVGGLTEKESQDLLAQIAASSARTEWAELERIATPILQNAIKEGDPIKVVIADLEKAFAGYDIANEAHRLETVVRTNVNTIFNQGRDVAFRQNAELIEALQFSAIMDSRTTDICSSLDQKVFTLAESQSFTPALHFNCRSILVPILIGEKIDPVDKKLPKTESAGGGFRKVKGSKNFKEYTICLKT